MRRVIKRVIKFLRRQTVILEMLCFTKKILPGSNPFRRHRRNDVAESHYYYAPLPWSRVFADIADNFGNRGPAAAIRRRDPWDQIRYRPLDFPPRMCPDKISRPPTDSSISVMTGIRRPGNGISIAYNISQVDFENMILRGAQKPRKSLLRRCILHASGELDGLREVTLVRYLHYVSPDTLVILGENGGRVFDLGWTRRRRACILSFLLRRYTFTSTILGRRRFVPTFDSRHRWRNRFTLNRFIQHAHSVRTMCACVLRREQYYFIINMKDLDVHIYVRTVSQRYFLIDLFFTENIEGQVIICHKNIQSLISQISLQY